MPDAAASRERRAATAGRWLLLIHQLPPEPAYLRVKVRRHLVRIGAQPLKNSVYVLPNSAESLEDFHWLRRAIVDDGGDATVSVCDFVEGTSDTEVEEQFRQASRQAYADFVKLVRKAAADGSPREIERLRTKLKELTARDPFNAPGRGDAERALEQVVATRREPDGQTVTHERPAAATWVTRRGVFVDRMASAWLIRRFIDPAARFRFVDESHFVPRRGELRFDMFEGEFTHEKDRCTFQVLVDRFGLSSPALDALGTIVHDIDYKIEEPSLPETAAVQLLLRGICLSREHDDDRIEAARPVFDGLHASFERGG